MPQANPIGHSQPITNTKPPAGILQGSAPLTASKIGCPGQEEIRRWQVNRGGSFVTGRGRQWAAKTSHTRLGTHLSFPGPWALCPLGMAAQLLSRPGGPKEHRGKDGGLDPSPFTLLAPVSEFWPSLIQMAHSRAPPPHPGGEPPYHLLQLQKTWVLTSEGPMDRGNRPMATLASKFSPAPMPSHRLFPPPSTLVQDPDMAGSLSLLGLNEMLPLLGNLFRPPWTCSLCPASHADFPNLHILKGACFLVILSPEGVPPPINVSWHRRFWSSMAVHPQSLEQNLVHSRHSINGG